MDSEMTTLIFSNQYAVRAHDQMICKINNMICLHIRSPVESSAT